MHELGIMTSVLDTVEQAATDAGATRVISIMNAARSFSASWNSSVASWCLYRNSA